MIWNKFKKNLILQKNEIKIKWMYKHLQDKSLQFYKKEFHIKKVQAKMLCKGKKQIQQLLIEFSKEKVLTITQNNKEV